MQARALRQLFQADGLGMLSKDFEQTDHALDYLDGTLGFRFSHARPPVSNRAILHRHAEWQRKRPLTAVVRLQALPARPSFPSF
jgi:hypothetical protein